MPKLDLAAIPTEDGCSYPSPFERPCLGASWKRLGNAGGLTQFGVNLSRLPPRLPPGVWSSQRHWHTHEDELVYLLEGELVLVSDDGETVLRAGDVATFKAGEPNGHHLINRSDRDAVVLEVGTRDPGHDRCDYSDIDMIAEPKVEPFLHRDGSPYPVSAPTTWLVGQAP